MDFPARKLLPVSPAPTESSGRLIVITDPLLVVVFSVFWRRRGTVEPWTPPRRISGSLSHAPSGRTSVRLLFFRSYLNFRQSNGILITGLIGSIQGSRLVENLKGTVSRKLRHRLLYIIRKLFFYTFDACHGHPANYV